jgi:hypothetical protein
MSRSARSVGVFGVYLVPLGLALLVVPNLLLRAFGLAPTSEVWIRVVGMLVLILSFYYVQAARRELTDFFRWSVIARSFVFLTLGTLAVLGLGEPQLALFGAVDLVGAAWTGVSLRRAGVAATSA